MTVATTDNKIQYVGNGVAVAFATGFKFYDEVHLEVYLFNTVTGVETLQVLNTDYTVAGEGDPGGGTVTFGTPPTSDERVTILRIVPFVQDTDYVNNDDRDMETLERDLDELTMMMQQGAEENERAIKLPKSTTIEDLELPTPAANKFLRWNNDADGIENADTLAGTISAAINPGDAGKVAKINATEDGFLAVDGEDISASMYAADTGAANAYLVALAPAPSAYAAGQVVRFKPANTNTGASTINLNALGAKAIQRIDGAALSAGDLQAGMVAVLVYEATAGAFQLLNPYHPVAAPMRQTVLSGGVDANGYANFISAGGGLNVDLAATATSLRLAFAAGFGANGPLDFIAGILADVAAAWTIPDVAQTNYLYIERNPATGSLTYGKDNVAPSYGYAHPAGPGAGDHSYLIPAGKMYEYSGAAWVEKQRVFVGEATGNGAGGISSVVTYALHGRYASTEQTVSLNTNISVNHNLGVLPWMRRAVLRCKTAEHGHSPGDEADFMSTGSAGTQEQHPHFVNRLLIGTGIGDSGIYVASRSVHTNAQVITGGNWKIVFYAERGW